jgi:hypothetical protein
MVARPLSKKRSYAGMKVRETTVRLDMETSERLREAVFKRRVSKQFAIEEGIKIWLDKTSDLVKTPVARVVDSGAEFKNAEERKWVTKLLRVLRSPHAKAITAVTENLEVFSLYCDMADREHGRVAQDAGAPALRRAKGSGKTA